MQAEAEADRPVTTLYARVRPVVSDDELEYEGCADVPGLYRGDVRDDDEGADAPSAFLGALCDTDGPIRDTSLFEVDLYNERGGPIFRGTLARRRQRTPQVSIVFEDAALDARPWRSSGPTP